jgi:hypothetical protein
MTTSIPKTYPEWSLYHSVWWMISLGGKMHESGSIAAVVNLVSDEDRARAADLVNRYCDLVDEATALKDKHKPDEFRF